MNTKFFFAALAIGAFSTSAVFAQDGSKTKSSANGATIKTKAANDGKLKIKGKDKAGNKMKASAKPAKGEHQDTRKGVMVGGALMTPDKDIVDNAAESTDHTTLVTAVKAAGLVETLKSAGPFTVFAPTNAAFGKLPVGTVEKLTQPDMRGPLATILTYHVLSGRLLASDLKNGMKLPTVEGEPLTVVKEGKDIMLRDAKGGMAKITIANVISSNGVTHVIDTVLMPTKQ